MAAFAFNLAEIAPSETFDVIPAGSYLGQVLASELRATKAGTGQYVWLEQEIIEGQYKGRKLWTTLNVINPNDKTAEMAQRQLRALCDAVGQIINDDKELPLLHFKPIIMVVKVKPAEGQYPAKNEVSGYKPVEGSTPTSAQRPVTAPIQKNHNPVMAPVASAQKPVPSWHKPRAA